MQFFQPLAVHQVESTHHSGSSPSSLCPPGASARDRRVSLERLRRLVPGGSFARSTTRRAASRGTVIGDQRSSVPATEVPALAPHWCVSTCGVDQMFRSLRPRPRWISARAVPLLVGAVGTSGRVVVSAAAVMVAVIWSTHAEPGSALTKWERYSQRRSLRTPWSRGWCRLRCSCAQQGTARNVARRVSEVSSCKSGSHSESRNPHWEEDEE